MPPFTGTESEAHATAIRLPGAESSWPLPAPRGAPCGESPITRMVAGRILPTLPFPAGIYIIEPPRGESAWYGGCI